MSTEENKLLIRRFNEEAFSGRDIKVRDRFLGSGFAINGQVVDPDRSRRNVAELFAAFPDFHRSMDDIIADGDKVVARYTARGTHLGELLGVQPTGTSVTVRWVTIYRIADGKVAEEWPLFDALGLMRQPGVAVPGP
jgi:predicted ester cyclase